MTKQELEKAKKEWKEKKMKEADEVRKEFPNISALDVYATFIMCRFNPDETRKALKKF